ncbi:MAG: SGNH/GDSL hydrolase family protein [Acetatifactor sp.]
MKKRRIPIIPLVIVGLILWTVGGSVICTKMLKNQQMELTLDALSMEEYQSVFLSMYDISTFSEEDFTDYRAIPTLKLDYCLDSADKINQMLDAVFSSGNQITNVYLGLDPLALWHSEKNDITKVQEAFETGWFAYADAHPEVTFEILFPFQSMSYWLSLEEGELQASLILYQQLASILTSRSNITVYYVGAQEWLINNPANYVSDFVTNELVSQKLFLLTFCDHKLQINGRNAKEMVEQLSEQIAANREAPAEYPDFSQWDIVFMGDSILGNYEGSISIPGVVNGLSGASVFNCAQGGVSAAEPAPGMICFPKMAEDFVNGTVSDSETSFCRGTQEYLSADHTDKKLCFIINFGLNDYFGGHAPENPEDAYDITTYAGAMRTGFATLREKYPDAMYIIMGPGQTTYFSDGTELLSETGGQLIDYYNLSVALSEELDIPYLDLYNHFPEGDDDLIDVLSDGCHYNEYGRYVLGIKIVNFMGSCQ